MGILSSLYTGVTGMQGQGEALAIYGDNIANANTTGFKVSRPEFQDVIAKSLKGLLGGNQIGRGTKLAAVNPMFSQGSIIQTDSPTDLALSGDGFFMLKGIDGVSFTRNGAFHFDKDGKLITTDNLRVQGYLADEEGKITSQVGDIGVERNVIDARGTRQVELFMNLDSRVSKELVFDPEKPERTSHYAAGVTVYDTVGSPHVVTVYFNKTDDKLWSWKAMAKGEDIVGGEKGKMVEQATGTLTFAQDGRLESQTVDNSAFNFIGAQEGQAVEFFFGKDKASQGDGMQVTSYGTTSEVYRSKQDGFTAGALAGLTFNDDGTLTAVYTNGEHFNVAQTVLAKYENPEGLFKVGQNRYRESSLSGPPTIGMPKTGGRGSIEPKAVESSTTDIAQEFINLMGAQRNFQANARVISTSDRMLQEIINLNK